MSNLGTYFKAIICDYKESCKTHESYCRKCTRNKASILKDYYSIDGKIDYEWLPKKENSELIKEIFKK